MISKKRGMLLAEETIKIIIAVIAIFFLIYFLTSLYLAHQKSRGLEFAEASLEHLIEHIKNNDGKAETSEVEIQNPSSWWILSWPTTTEDGEILMPNSCSNIGLESCVCICRIRGVFKRDFRPSKGDLKVCDDSGVCLGYVKNIIIDEEYNRIKIEPILELKIEYGDEIIIRKK